MSMILGAPPGTAQNTARPTPVRAAMAAWKRWWLAYVTWRVERLVRARLGATGHRELAECV
jgi:hypothetical protein